MIETVLERWHAIVRGDTEDLADLLADDVVFYSPILFTPQRGRDVTTVYLLAAKQVLGGGGFRYIKQVVDGDTAVLEFETTLADTYVNGVDIIRVGGAGRIVEFRVMIRPLRAMNAVHERMRLTLEARQ